MHDRPASAPSVFEALFVVTVSLGVLWGLGTGAPVGDFLWLVAIYASALLVVTSVVTRAVGLPAELARALAGVSLTFVVYGGLNPLFVDLGGRAIDRELQAFEQWLFGSSLVELALPFVNDGWIAFASAIYSVHVPLFFLPALLHWRAGRRERALRLELTLALSMYIGFVGYVLWPAYGPVGALMSLPPLATNPVTALVAAEGVALGTFPSLHGGISAAVAIDAWRTSRRWALVFVPLAGLVWASTIVLRYHWLPDLFAGAALAVLATLLAPRVARWYDGALIRATHRGKSRRDGPIEVEGYAAPLPAGERAAGGDRRAGGLRAVDAADASQAGG